MGKLIVVEGVDGSGKATQSQRLYERLIEEGYNVKLISFPDYDNASSFFVKNYLAGKYGDKAKDVNPYVASSFFALDRYHKWESEVRDFYEQDDSIIIADRYVQANMIHQASKIRNIEARAVFVEWLKEFEFAHLGLPIPDTVFYLNIPADVSVDLMKDRLNKANGKKAKDIHEKDIEYLKKCCEAANTIAVTESWKIIDCMKDDRKLRSIDSIHEEVCQKIFCELDNNRAAN